ncbi:hypothetical protein PISMIDRAFT_604605 [Pisolithus microcarpus 441]|uniref:Uncharacterized protein n=1 Tax=Pisolithus microcarpus 441 TaxID=765257 RepID=A0A0C9ZFN3_9AGAM|nr:hypothetical protein PISMIDRAFT_604605 [Pisolithus microcarpus 441]
MLYMRRIHTRKHIGTANRSAGSASTSSTTYTDIKQCLPNGSDENELLQFLPLCYNAQMPAGNDVNFLLG